MINYIIMSLKQKKIKFEPRMKLNHNICTTVVNLFTKATSGTEERVAIVERCLNKSQCVSCLPKKVAIVERWLFRVSTVPSSE